MKKILLTLILFCSSNLLLAQQKAPYQKEITNETLRSDIGVYVSQTAQWAKANKIPDYLICMLCDTYKGYHIFTLTIVTDQSDLEKLQLSSYTEIQGTPVLIQNKTAAFFKNEPPVVSDVLKKYNKKLLNAKADMAQKAKEEQAAHALKADSLIFHTPQGDKKLALKDYPSVTISSTNDGAQAQQPTMELTFYGNNLQNIKRY